MQVSGVAPGFVGPEACIIWESSQKKNTKLKMHNQVQMWLFWTKEKNTSY